MFNSILNSLIFSYLYGKLYFSKEELDVDTLADWKDFVKNLEGQRVFISIDMKEIVKLGKDVSFLVIFSSFFRDM